MNLIEYNKPAVIFPGQGSQSVGMLGDMAAEFSQVKDTFAEASDVLGYDLWQLCQAGPEQQLNRTEYAQPALLTAGVAAWRVCNQQLIVEPKFLAGHSLGEYAALVCAGTFSFTDAVQLIAERGRLMQRAVAADKGAMVAIIGLIDKEIEEVCLGAAQDQVLAVANYNSIGQTVLAGDYAAAERAVALAKQAGAKIAKLLKVSVPAHCQLMKPIAEQFAKILQDLAIRVPELTVVNNVDVTVYSSVEQIRDSLVRQLYNPVRWVETIQYFQQEQVDCLIECGPGKILAGLNKRIVRELPTFNFTQLL